jgi:nicotinate-nucleotide adenylyltransferase
MRLGILGGTLDPIHRGHLDAAHAARRLLSLDRVLFIPAHVPPHRSRAPLASGYHRFAMTAIAVLGIEGFLASDLELAREGPSFSVETIRLLQKQGWQRSQLFFITGVDAFAEVSTWRDYPELLDECHFVVVARPGHPADALRRRLPSLEARFVEADDRPVDDGRLDGSDRAILLVNAHTADVSSTEIRRRLRDGLPLQDAVPDGVERYIRQHHLYASVPEASELHGQI